MSTTKELAAKYDLFMPCPPVNHFHDDGRYLKLRRSLIAAARLSLRDLQLHHPHGAGELDIPEGYGAPVTITPLVRSPSGSALASVV